ncbi:hypothetical protein DITRI_Ditri17bG0035000 [Diplodiscus trichospermus]
MAMWIIRLGFDESKQLPVTKLVARMDFLGLLPTSGFQQVLIISLTSVKTTMKLFTRGFM